MIYHDEIFVTRSNRSLLQKKEKAEAAVAASALKGGDDEKEITTIVNLLSIFYAINKNIYMNGLALIFKE